MTVIMQGVILLVVGMVVLFAAMALLILAMVLLERLFRTPPLASDERESSGEEAFGSLARGTEHEEVVAAIAVALAHLRSTGSGMGELGAALEAGHGPWWTMGRIQHRFTNIGSSARAGEPLQGRRVR